VPDMLAFHRVWALAVVGVNVIAGLWGLNTVRRKRDAGRALWSSIVAGQVALAVQVTVGVLLSRRVKPPGLHVFYGFMLLFVAVLSWMFRGETSRRALAVASGVALFVGVVAIRTMVTAHR